MNNSSFDSRRRRSGLRNRTPSRSDRSRSIISYHDTLQDIPLQDMAHDHPGHAVSTDITAVGSTETIPKQDEPSNATPGWKRGYQAVTQPFVHCFKVTKRKLKQPGEDKVGWKRTTFILLTEQVGLALGMAPYVYNVLGYVNGTLVYLLAAALCYYTNIILFRFRRDHGAITSICDIANELFGTVGKYTTLTFFTLCAIMIAAAHIREGGDFITITKDTWRWSGILWFYEIICPEIGATVLMAFLVLAVALPRNFRVLSIVSMATVPLTIASVIGALCILWTSDEGVGNKRYEVRPFGYSDVDHPRATQISITAVLCVIFTFLVQPTSPAVMSDMRVINDFPKALKTSTGIQLLLFIVIGVLGYVFEGTHNIVGTVFNFLPQDQLSIAFYGMIQPSVILQAGLFINVLGREIWQSAALNAYPSFAGGSRFSKYWWTRQAWWMLLLFVQVLAAWLFAGSITDLSNLIGLVAAIPGCYFFFILPACVAIYEIRRVHQNGLPGASVLFNRTRLICLYTKQGIVILIGLTMLILGVWASLKYLLHHSGTNAGGVRNPFTCADKGVKGVPVASDGDLFRGPWSD